MAAMAPALTDASAHPSSFKLPISPSDTGQTGFEATPSDPTSPGLPNGHSNTGHTHINSDQAIQELGLDKDLLQQGIKDQPEIIDHRLKVRLFRTSPHRGSRISSNSRLTFLGKIERGKVSGSLAFPLSTRAPGLTNGGVSVGNDVTKMSHSTATGTYDKQQPCQASAHIATTVTMPPETSSLSLPNSTDVTGSSSTATADSSEAEEDLRAGQGEIHPFDETDSGRRQDLDISYDKIVLSLNNAQNTEGFMRDSRNTELLSELLNTEQVNEVANKRSKLADRARQLVQKLRHLQTHQISTHTKQQVQNFVQEQRKSSFDKAAEADIDGCPECRRNSTLLNPSDPNVPSTSRKGYSATSDGTKEQHPRTCYHKKKPLPARATDVDTSVRVTVKTASKRLQAKLEHVESWVDSDETEGSSGGESCDEGDDTLPSYTQTRQKHKVPLHRRAVWKWAVERAAIASRWTWLQAQVSDLEYRIRQQSDIYRQTRASKGVAILGEPSSPEELLKVRVMTSTKTNRKLSPIEAKIARLSGNQEMSPSNLSTLLTNVDQQSARLKRSLQNCVSPMSGLPIPPSATSTPTGGGGKAPFPKPMNGIVGNSGSHRTPLFNRTASSPSVTHKQSQEATNSFSSPTLVPTVPEETYCARTRPVWYFRKRKLIRTMNMHNFSRKIQKLSTVRCGCCPPLTPCVMCGGRFNHVEKPKEPDMAPLNERVAQLDFSFHPVLSFPQDVPLSIQFEGMMKSNEWQRKPPPSKQSPMRKKRRPSTPTESKEGQKPKRKYERKNKDKDKRRQTTGEDKSLKILRKLAAQTMKDMRHGRGDNKMLKRANSKANSLPNTPKKLLTEEINRRCRTDIKKRRAAQLAIAALKKTRARSFSLPNIKDHFHHNNGLSSGPTTPTLNDGNPSATHMSQSMPCGSLQNFLKPRRPGGSSDQYDIDNIVIPYSMLASTRVEKLEYKEIMTPKWRKIPEEQLLAWKNHVQDVNNHEEEFENLSDSEFIDRHTKCEITERRKFLTILANQTTHAHQRRGARRSRNNSQGNTPEPYSPDANLFDQNQPSSVNSSNAPSPLTTQEALSPSGAVSLGSSWGGAQRSRNSSWEKRRSSSTSDTNPENSLHGSFEEIGHIDNPWPMRNFPLDEVEVDELGWEPEEEEEPEVKKEPEGEEKTPSEFSSSTTTSLLNNIKTEGGSSPSSPLGELLDESSGQEDVEDPNDPEWTVVSPDRQRSSIVLRLAKR